LTLIFRDNNQTRAWLTLAKLADEVGDNLPCRQAPDLYFAGQGETYETNLAKKACKSCPIQEQCLSYALTFKEHEGVWGGLTAGERKKIRYRK
jgi:WhiB family transcriptional regulator, redox-sensing transcriptional regulator